LYSTIMINTYNETSLHNELKNRYAEKTHGKIEQKIGKYICDIETEDGNIIEIQTRNLAKLTGKIANLLQEKRKVCLVYPLVYINYIERYNDDGVCLSKRKSPKKHSMYELFDELMGVYPILLYKNFKLEVLLIEQVEIRQVTAEPVQNETKTRRRLKPWIKSNKQLKSIIDKKSFSKPRHYIMLLPEEIPSPFCASDLAKTEVGKYAHKMLWVLNKMELIERVEVKSRSYYYKVKDLYTKE
jgi:hypothetical protein